MNRLRQFWHYTTKVFRLQSRLRWARDRRADPLVPTWAVTATLFVGALSRKPSFLQIESESRRRGWQRLIGYDQPITDDRMAYVCERYGLEVLRAVLVGIVAWLLILVLAFNLFELFVRLHGKLWRLGTMTMREAALQLDRALERWEELQPLWSG